MLKVKNLDAFYGKAQVLRKVGLEIREGQAVALLGPNGAGKTTTMMSISKLIRISETSEIEFRSERIDKLKPEKVVSKGIVHVPQGRGVFPGLTIRENLLMGAYLRSDTREINADVDRLLDLFPKFRDRINQPGGTLSGGEQQMLAIMRGLMAKPKLLMLDEPSMGLAPIIVEQVYETIAKINKSGITILLVEQNTHMALMVTDYAYVLSVGSIVLEGTSAEIKKNENMLKSYFAGKA